MLVMLHLLYSYISSSFIEYWCFKIANNGVFQAFDPLHSSFAALSCLIYELQY